MKRTLVYLSLAVIALTTLVSCHRSIVYSQFTPIPSGEWHMDSILHFDYTIADTSVDYRMMIYIRHTERYPYQNMWLFVGDSLSRDTIRFFLADDRGKWLGDKNSGLYEVPVIFGDHLHFADTGTYHLDIQQGLRDTLLRGVMDVGVEITESERN
jgi:gliding motility-associated lipoprotein GldH